MKICTAEQMARIDRRTIDERHLPGLLLMEHAGVAVCRVMAGEQGRLAGRKVLVLCGGGNNGGDGFVVARHLRLAGASVAVALFKDPSEIQGDARINLEALAKMGCLPERVHSVEELLPALEQAEMVVDAMLGTGTQGEVQGLYRDAVDAVNRGRKAVYAVDIPSGVHCDTGDVLGAAIRARCTITMGLPKRGFFRYPGRACVGRLVVADIGFPRDLIGDPALPFELSLASRMKTHLPLRLPDTHKGTYGAVVVVGGAVGMLGAPLMAAKAALRAGAGMVKLIVPASARLPLVGAAPELLVYGAPETSSGSISEAAVPTIVGLLDNAKILLLGPGIARDPATVNLIRSVLGRVDAPLVLDADGLRALGPEDGFDNQEVVLTPHLGEMSTLCSRSIEEIKADPWGVLEAQATRMKAHIVLKGPFSAVGTPSGKIFINPSGNEGMASAGSGDVLAGLIAGLMAQPHRVTTDMVRLATYLHGLTGDIAAEKLGRRSLVAPDLLDAIPEAFKILERIDGPPEDPYRMPMIPNDRVDILTPPAGI